MFKGFLRKAGLIRREVTVGGAGKPTPFLRVRTEGHRRVWNTQRMGQASKIEPRRRAKVSQFKAEIRVDEHIL